MTIGKIFRKKIITVSKECSLTDAAKQMYENNIGCLIIVNDPEKVPFPIGIITDRDIVIKCIAKEHNIKDIQVKDIMSKDLLTLSINDGLHQAIAAMKEKGVRRAPVVNEDNKLCGIVTVDDLIDLLSHELSDLAKLVLNQDNRLI